MPGPVQLTGLQGYVQQAPEADPTEVQGGSVNPNHARAFWAEPELYPWESGINGLDASSYPIPIFTDSVGTLPEGEAAGDPRQDPGHDYTPYHTHAAPWPKGLDGIRKGNQQPQGTSEFLDESAGIHASNTNASAQRVYMPQAQQDDWDAFYTVTPGESMVDTNVGPQIKSGSAPGGWASHSRAQTFARQNEYGFDSAHKHRRWARGSIPGNYMWMRPGGRPMVKSIPGPARPAVGETSPFNGQDVSWGYAASSQVGGVLVNSPTEYSQPAQPYITPNGAVYGEDVPDMDYY
jgi:hypothetical protein